MDVVSKLRKHDLGKSGRQNDFRVDAALLANWIRLTEFVNENTGFHCDRLCPSAGRTRAEAYKRGDTSHNEQDPACPKERSRYVARIRTTRMTAFHDDRFFDLSANPRAVS